MGINFKSIIKIEVNTVNCIFKQLFQYGFHDTEISSIECEGLEIKLNFDQGIYLLDENGKETVLSKPMQVVLKIDSYFDSFEEAFEKHYDFFADIFEYLIKDYTIPQAAVSMRSIILLTPLQRLWQDCLLAMQLIYIALSVMTRLPELEHF